MKKKVWWIAAGMCLVVCVTFGGYYQSKINTARKQEINIKRDQQKAKDLQSKTSEINTFGASDERRTQVESAYQSAKQLAELFVKEQNVISNQQLSEGSAPNLTDDTKKSQEILSKKIGDYSPKDDNTGTMDKSTVLLNWFDKKAGQTLSYSQSSNSRSTSSSVVFKVQQGDKTVSFITARYDPKNDKFVDFTSYQAREED